ncbi:hypothetical protein GCM10010324_06440 [Streptomyces hiroshimensis]|uniref:Uncharacterized protein n=1 Tax=Streptomyces hiroshimensis TaxID=66424 RepID=A0ABQ2Y4R9_9ACTN|nr:hypothetical protein GCM10010324_06440 [Streptomyces hiroshimensis]
MPVTPFIPPPCRAPPDPSSSQGTDPALLPAEYGMTPDVGNSCRQCTFDTVRDTAAPSAALLPREYQHPRCTRRISFRFALRADVPGASRRNPGRVSGFRL